MDNKELVLDGDAYLISTLDGEFELTVQVGKEEPPDLYNIWTDVVGLYLGRDMQTGYGLFTSDRNIDVNGEVVAGRRAVCEAYIPISSHYEYFKSNHRIISIAYYNEDKQLISKDDSGRYENSTYGIRLIIPYKAKYMRLVTNQVIANWALQIIRIA